jgi:hypothetical protein
MDRELQMYIIFLEPYLLHKSEFSMRPHTGNVTGIVQCCSKEGVAFRAVDFEFHTFVSLEGPMNLSLTP